MRHDGNGERSRGRATGGSEAKRKHARDALARARSPGMRSRRGETRWRWGAETRRVPQPPRVRPCTPWSRLDKRMRRRRGALVVRRSGGSARSGRGFERACLERPRDGVAGTRRLGARVCARGSGFRALRQTRGTERFFVVRTNPPNFHRTGVASETSALVATPVDAFAAKCAAVRGRARRGKRRISPRGVAATPRCPSRWTSSWCRARRS